ncbi:hypothetical protein HWQ46_23665 [Shewanella sp. D64]|uniref:hypothetical protein n=1 Tax=unclassified Shewanella TaxID=196818 RepID=UPI0022BA35BD|nr:MULTISPECIES: hypothetical protein [unclassified Shewanella]MEC4728525.1 hypothetical protein [Shewanella sp. D64]MEC4740314.1 hypothetical protein [Shewanella sp. E94]WBJ94291.1 hypothetical protein HWQ47_20735 [Shewanella sp. MTB7]
MYKLNNSKSVLPMLSLVVAGIVAAGISVEVEAKSRAKGFYTRGDISHQPGSRNGYDDPNIADTSKPTDWGKEVDGIVVQVEWNALQPDAPVAPGQKAVLDSSWIDAAIDDVETWNDVPGNNKLGIKLRVFAGIYTPQWVKNEAGSSTLDFKGSNFDGDFPHFWKSAFKTRYKELHQLLAAKYDSEPLIKEIAISACMIKNADMHRARSEYQNINILVDAGLTWQKDRNCQTWQITAVAGKWDNTRVSVARPHFRKFKKMTSPPLKKDWPLSKSTMQSMVETCRLESNCIIGNNSLEIEDKDDNAFSNDSHPLYYVAGKYRGNQSKAPVYYQTDVKVVQGSVLIHNIIHWGIQNSDVKLIELPPLKAFKKYDDNNSASTNYLASDNMQKKRTKLKN